MNQRERPASATGQAMPAQLTFPWAPVQASPIASLRLGSLTATLSASGVEVAVHLRDESDQLPSQMGYWRRDLSVQIRTVGHVMCVIQGQGGRWGPERVPEAPGDGDALACAHQWAMEALRGAHQRAGCSRMPVAREQEADLSALFERAAREAVSRCEPGARALALAFDPRDQWGVYAELVRDGTGRMAQLAAVCPALLATLSRIEDTAAMRRVTAAIVAGARLSRVLEMVADPWLEHVERVAVTGNRLAPVYRRALSEPDGPRRLQRLLWRRAGTAVPGEALWLPFPRSVLIDDVPLRDNTAWFRSVSGLWTDLRSHQQLGLDGIERLAGFVSARLGSLERAASEHSFHGVDSLVAGIVDHAQATGQIPDRRSGAARVVREIVAWHDLMAGDVLDLPPETPLAPAPCQRWARGGLALVALEVARELGEESQHMHHCVASFAGEAVRGRVFVYRGTYQGERITVAISPWLTGWELAEAAGFGNRPISPDARRAIDAWLSAISG